MLRVGAGVTYTRVISELGHLLPALAIASRTVGSPQIRNRGTVGGNLGSASPAGDAHPPLLAGGASVEVASVRGSRVVPVEEFFTGPKRQVLEPDELISAFLVRPATGPQQFSQGWDAQRHGHRGGVVRPGPGPPSATGRDRHRFGRPHPRPGRRGRGVPGRRAGRGQVCGSRDGRSRRTSWPISPNWWPPPPRP